MPVRRMANLRAWISTLALSVVWGLTIEDFNGKWTDAEYGGSLSLCVDSATGYAHGFYSEVGYARGIVVEANDRVVWSGQWYEGGDYDDGTNFGNFVVTLAEDGASFSGGWTYSTDSTETFPWEDTRLSSEVQNITDCWFVYSQPLISSFVNTAPQDKATLHGSWKDNNLYTLGDWYICIDGGRFTSSYLYTADENSVDLIPGYIEGEVQADGQVLLGDWFEDGSTGMYILTLGSSRDMYASFWNVSLLDDIDISHLENADAHGVEITKRVTSTATASQCSRFEYLKTGEYPSGDDDDDDDISPAVVGLATSFALIGAAILGAWGYHAYNQRFGGRHHHHHHHRHHHHQKNPIEEQESL